MNESAIDTNNRGSLAGVKHHAIIGLEILCHETVLVVARIEICHAPKKSSHAGGQKPAWPEESTNVGGAATYDGLKGLSVVPYPCCCGNLLELLHSGSIRRR